MVEHDRRLRKGARQIGDVPQLRVEDPGVEAEAERGEAGEPLAKIAVAVEAVGRSQQ